MKIILMCSEGTPALAELIAAVGKLDCVERVYCEIDEGKPSMYSCCSDKIIFAGSGDCGKLNGRELDEIIYGEAADVPPAYFFGGEKVSEKYLSGLREQIASGIDDMIKEAEAAEHYRRYIDPPRPVPYINQSHGKPSKSKAKPHRPMIRRTC